MVEECLPQEEQKEEKNFLFLTRQSIRLNKTLQYCESKGSSFTFFLSSQGPAISAILRVKIVSLACNSSKLELAAMNLNLFDFYKNDQLIPPALRLISSKVLLGKRITPEDGLALYQSAPLGLLAYLADSINQQKNGGKVFYNTSLHVELTNICYYSCPFCSVYKKDKDEESWNLTLKELAEILHRNGDKGITEVVISGACHPDHNLDHYVAVVEMIRRIFPKIHIKAFSATDLHFVAKKGRMNMQQVFKKLHSVGINSLTGGGAEIFHPEVREKLGPEKLTGDEWLNIHEMAHSLGIKTNASMLYGHIESYKHRIEHLNELRLLQDRTTGFLSFIPLKYKKENSNLASLGEVPLVEDLRNFAVARIFLDNIDHLVVYWPMIGKEATQLSFNFGISDLSGIAENPARIYSTSKDGKVFTPFTVSETRTFIEQAGKIPVERNSYYKSI